MPISRYLPSRHYLPAGILALASAAFSVWCGFRWAPAFLPAILLLMGAAVVFFLAFQPPIEIHESHLRIRDRVIPWNQVRRLDRTGWISPLVMHLTLHDDSRILLVYPGDLDSATGLLRHLRRYSRESLIDGVPYKQFWGEIIGAAPERRQLPSPKYPMLRPEDEAEIELMFQRLKTVGHIDPKKSSDEK